jgi:triosephosphate isomerase
VYGGSVNSGNCKNILEVPNISGLLIGGASLNAAELLKILNS